MDLMKMWPSLLMVLTNLVDAFSDVISAWMAGHPKVALVLAGLVGIVANFVKSPKQG